MAFTETKNEPPAIPCAVCGDSSTCDVWCRPFCDRCFAFWLAEAPNAGEASKLATADQLASSKAKGGELCDFYMPWTAAWVKRNAQKVAA